MFHISVTRGKSEIFRSCVLKTLEKFIQWNNTERSVSENVYYEINTINTNISS